MGTKKSSPATTKADSAASQPKTFSLISNQKLLDLYDGLLRFSSRDGHASGARGRARRREDTKGYEAGWVAGAIDLTAGDSLRLTAPGGFTPVTPSVDGLLQAFSATNADANPHRRQNASSSRGRSASPWHELLGTALIQKTAKQGAITVVLAQDEDDAEWPAMLRVAAVHSLPLILLRQPRSASSQHGTAKGRSRSVDTTEPYLPNIPVDRSDVVAIYRVASEAIGRARKGRGPTVIECLPFQLDPLHETRSRAAGSAQATGRRTDAVTAMENYLRGKGLILDSGPFVTKSAKSPRRARSASGRS